MEEETSEEEEETESENTEEETVEEETPESAEEPETEDVEEKTEEEPEEEEKEEEGGFKREMYKATCADCGKECEVPFRPTAGRPVYCRDCYRKHRPQRRRF
jgi:CxxC-x17-CxxC domain-containing protein